MPRLSTATQEPGSGHETAARFPCGASISAGADQPVLAAPPAGEAHAAVSITVASAVPVLTLILISVPPATSVASGEVSDVHRLQLRTEFSGRAAAIALVHTGTAASIGGPPEPTSTGPGYLHRPGYLCRRVRRGLPRRQAFAARSGQATCLPQRRSELAAALIAAGRRLGKSGGDHLIDGGRQAGTALGQRGRRLRHLSPHDREVLLRGKGGVLVSISTAAHASAYSSARPSTGWPWICSGAT